MMFHLVEENKLEGAVIKIIGVGGGGSNAVNYMVRKKIEGVEFICSNTDMQALKNSHANHTIQLGTHLTKGLGAGSDPAIGREAARESEDAIRKALESADMAFITAGLGGGTGSGAAPIIAKIAKDLGILTVAVVTKPFGFERRKRSNIAEQGMLELHEHVDSLITIPNDKLRTVFGDNMTLVEAFERANDVLYGAVQGIAELITCDGLINLDFADVRTVMSETGMAMIGSGSASGEGRAQEAADSAIHNPLLEDMDLNNAHGLLVNITSANVTIEELEIIGRCFSNLAVDDANVVVGAVTDESMGDTLRTTLVATGLDMETHSTSYSATEQDTETVPLDGTQIDVQAVARTYQDYDKPPALRETDEKADKDKDKYNDLLDIPAFLRQQVD